MIWDPYTQKGIQLLNHAVQRICARFMYNSYYPYASVTNMQENLNWSPLADCRKQLKAITMFKIMHHLLDIPTENLLTLVFHPAIHCVDTL